MAFTSTITDRTVFGNKMVNFGTYTNSVGSGTGGDINTGLTMCEMLIIIPSYSAVAANAPVVNETFPVAGSAVTIVTDAVMNGYWVAWGW